MQAFAGICRTRQHAERIDTQLERIDTLPELEVTAHNGGGNSATPVYILNKADIERRGITDIGDALRRLPGLNLRDYGGAGGLKTVSNRGLDATHTGVLYDGLPLTDIRSGQIDLSRYDVANIATLSIASGDNDEIFQPVRAIQSSSTLSISTLGLNAATNRGFDMTAAMRTASFGVYNPLLKLGYSNGKTFQANVLGEYTYARNDYPFTLTNGRLKTRERRQDSQMHSGNVEANIGIFPSENTSVHTKLYYYDNDRHLPGPVIYYLQKTNETLRDRNFFAQTRLRSKLSSVFSLMAMAKFNWAATRYVDIAGHWPGGRLDQRYYQRETYASTALLYTPLANLAFDYSADWSYNNLSSNLITNTNPYRNTVLQSLSARYGIGRVRFTGHLIHTLAMDRSRKEEGGKTYSYFSPSVSVAWTPRADGNLNIRASYKNGYRIPTFNELYFDNYGTLNLDAETASQYNLGITYSCRPGPSWLGPITTTCDGYYNRLHNKITAVPWNLFRWTMSNLGRVDIIGADVTASAEININRLHSLLIAGNYTLQSARIRAAPDRLDWNKQIPYTPCHAGAVSVAWNNPWVNVVVHTFGVSERWATAANLPESRLPGYTETGVTLNREFAFSDHAIDLKASVLNIFDKQYEVVARYPMPGRAFDFTISFKL